MAGEFGQILKGYYAGYYYLVENNGEIDELNNKKVVITDKELQGAYVVYGVRVQSKSYGGGGNAAFGNEIVFSGTAAHVLGAYAGAASDNTLVLTGQAQVLDMTSGNGTKLDAEVIGGHSEGKGNEAPEAYQHASRNIVAIGVDSVTRGVDGVSFTYDAGDGKGGARVEGSVIGGYNSGPNMPKTSPVNAIDNTVLIYKSEVVGNVIAGVDRSYDDKVKSNTNGNKVILVDAKVGGNVYGGLQLQAYNGQQNNPWVETIEDSDIREKNPDNTFIASGVNEVGGLNQGTYNQLDMTVGAENKDKAVITSKSDLDISGVTINVTGPSGNSLKLLEVDKADGTTGKITGDKNTSIRYEGTLVTHDWNINDNFEADDWVGFEKGNLIDSNGTISGDMVTVTTQHVNSTASKIFGESAAGTAALVSDQTSFMASTGLAAAKLAVRNGQTLFAAAEGGSSRYITGSHVTLSYGSVTAGYAAELALNTSRFTFAPYFDAGFGSSTSKVDDGTEADGRHSFYGLGFAAAWEHDSGLHAEALVRGGRAETKFNAAFAQDSANYKSEATYFAASLGAGYAWQMTDALVLDPYVRYTFTRVGSDSVALHTKDLDTFDLDAINVETLRAGLKFSAQMSDAVRARVGAAYERVFDGDAEGKISAIAIDAPSLSGNRGVFDLGLTIAPVESNVSLDLGVSAYAGDREGVTGSVMVNYAF